MGAAVRTMEQGQADYAAIENSILGTLATFWALSPASEHVILGTHAVFWALSPASEHGILGKSPPPRARRPASAAAPRSRSG
jgi:hypothetical protein